MQLQAWALTDTGCKRENNQDSFLIDEDLRLFIVADGMGGHKGGEIASAMAVETVQEVISEARGTNVNARDLLMRAYSRASQRIFDKSFENDGELRGMGTTMVLIFVQGNRMFVGNVGDSRCYLYASEQMWQITEDHSLVTEHLRAGIVSEEQIEQLLPKNVITRSVGYEREVSPDFFERDLTDGELFLLCSDGLTGMVEDLKIKEMIEDHTLGDLPTKCVDLAKANGGDDNITVMIVKVGNSSR